MVEAELDLSRLRREQETGINKTEADIEMLLSYKSDYESLMSKLKDLAGSFSRSAYIPFGHKAFVAGKLVHTNEILVHLGGTDNLFAELSTQEALQLIERRVARLDATVKKLKQQKSLIEDRLKFTKDFSKVGRVSSCGDVAPDENEIEITERCDSDEERAWRNRHKEAKKREKGKLVKSSPLDVTNRHVTFAESCELRPSDSDSSCDFLPSPNDVIYFKHSDVPSPLPRSEITDLSGLTVTEAVDLFEKHGGIFLPPAVQPFGHVLERSQGDNYMATSTSDVPTRISRFRSDRIRHQISS
ncbi:Prefoldin subunit [Paragonimus heterotremus]|uniref:Prefoldin subunit n=1 Tax=Paragonimus heterotremus TaxID=100268 RepID=A0A8J4T4P0_9TREM|nr:Prefoldin subunit [Paragonimus heterotremus]